jgi:N6-adenosine-specific RNA methylase IME4
MEFHDVCDIFPMMEGEEFDALVVDIGGYGQREPIWTYQGKIIDGRNRYKACSLLGIEPQYKEWSGEGSLVGLVISLNLKRRHLTGSQKAACAVEIEKQFAEETRKRQAHGMTAPGKTLVERFPEAIERARDEAGKILGVSGRYVSDAKTLKERAPAIFAQVQSGEKTIPQAKKELRHEELKTSIPAFPGQKYRVLYIDPPWKYGDQLVMDRYGAAERHYPTLSIQELCDLTDPQGRRVVEVAEDNAVLFLWVTSPLLSECWAVIRAWGFEYKASFVWDKEQHNWGHYNSVRHEFLLVCTRGSCLPDVPTLKDSVQSIPKTSKHSEKPEEFRAIIDELYPHGKRIELFARGNYQEDEDWDVWGNEV